MVTDNNFFDFHFRQTKKRDKQGEERKVIILTINFALPLSWIDTLELLVVITSWATTSPQRLVFQSNRSCKRPALVRNRDHLGLTFWVVAYGYLNFTLISLSFVHVAHLKQLSSTINFNFFLFQTEMLILLLSLVFFLV